MIEKIPTQFEQNEALSFEHLAPDVWKALAELPRSGWVKRGVENPETVLEHTRALVGLARTLKGFSDSDRNDLAEMLEVHDWPEAIHGDEIVLTRDPDYESRKASKAEKEKIAMETICAKLGADGERILNLWLRYENESSEIASVAHQLDKYQAIEKSLEYEKEQHIPLFREFFEYNGPFITHPILIERLRGLQKSWEQMAQ